MAERVKFTATEDTLPEGFGLMIFQQGANEFHIVGYRKQSNKAVSCSEPVAFFIFP